MLIRIYGPCVKYKYFQYEKDTNKVGTASDYGKQLMIGDTNSSMNVICDENQNESRDVDEGDNADNDDDNEKRDDEEKISIKTFRSSTPG